MRSDHYKTAGHSHNEVKGVTLPIQVDILDVDYETWSVGNAPMCTYLFSRLGNSLGGVGVGDDDG